MPYDMRQLAVAVRAHRNKNCNENFHVKSGLTIIPSSHIKEHSGQNRKNYAPYFTSPNSLLFNRKIV